MPGKILIIIVGAIAAIGAIFMVRSVLSSNADANQPVVVEKKIETPQTDVLIAVRDLQVGETIKPSDLAWAPWLDATLTERQITKDIRPDGITDFNGRIVRVPIYANEAILSNKVVSRGDTGIMAALLSPGMRAVSLEISVESASGGFILPDDRVDVVLTHEIEVDTGDGVEDFIQSLVILENVRVLAIDQGIVTGSESSSDIGSTATLELSQENASVLTFSERKGSLSLLLRSMSDRVAAGDEAKLVVEDLNSVTSSRVVIYRNGNRSQTNISGGE